MKLLTALFALTLPLHAAPDQREIDASFYCFKYVPGLETIGIATGETLKPVRLSTANITPSERLTVVGDVATLRGKSVADDGAHPDPVIGKVKIPAHIRKALIVMIPSAVDAAEPYNCFVLDQDNQEFPLGTYRIINFSPFAIRGAIGKSYIEAKSGGITGLALQGEAGTVLPARFEFSDGGKWNRLTETRCASRKDRRWLLCIYQDPGNKRMHMRSIPDRTTIAAAADEIATASVD